MIIASFLGSYLKNQLRDRWDIMQTKTYRNVLGALLLASLLFLSGCALLWLGAGGAGGYLIKKGEEGGSSKKVQSSGSEGRSSAKEY